MIYYDTIVIRVTNDCTEPELFADVSEAGAVFTPGSVEICLSIHSPLEYLEKTYWIVGKGRDPS